MAPAHAAQPRCCRPSQTALVKQYCATCHSDRGKAGGLSLAAFDAAKAAEHAESPRR